MIDGDLADRQSLPIPDLQLNPALSVEVLIVGNERTPVVILDDVLASTAPLLDYASRLAAFSVGGSSGYPGVRAALPGAYAGILLPRLKEVIASVYGLNSEADGEVMHELFSLVCVPPQKLHMLQCVPHFDSHNPFYFATVHYLNSGPHGGTGIFRHRPTGFESITEARYPLFTAAAEAHVRSHGPPPGRYINSSDDHFELIAEFEYRPNRLLLYPGYLLHSGLIDAARDLSDHPAEGRLTANLFTLFHP
ncbi:MAG: DUF6445 family protein [Pseudomonadota bacterium]